MYLGLQVLHSHHHLMQQQFSISFVPARSDRGVGQVRQWIPIIHHPAIEPEIQFYKCQEIQFTNGNEPARRLVSRDTSERAGRGHSALALTSRRRDCSTPRRGRRHGWSPRRAPCRAKAPRRRRGWRGWSALQYSATGPRSNTATGARPP